MDSGTEQNKSPDGHLSSFLFGFPSSYYLFAFGLSYCPYILIKLLHLLELQLNDFSYLSPVLIAILTASICKRLDTA